MNNKSAVIILKFLKISTEKRKKIKLAQKVEISEKSSIILCFFVFVDFNRREKCQRH